MRRLAPLLLILAAGVFAVAPLRRLPENATGPDVYRRTLPSVAWVLAAGQGKGTGFVVDAGKRRLVTCYHVVGENEACDVVFVWNKDGRPVADRALYLEHMPELRQRGLAVQGKIIRRDKAKDLALIEVPALPTGVAALTLAPTSVAPGERVWAIGCRYDVPALFGVAAGRARAVRVMREGYFSGGRHLAKGARLMLADAPINEGDSGGPLVNGRGEVVGVSAAVAWEAHGGGLFLDVSEVRAFLGMSDTPTSTPSSGVAYERMLRSTALVRYEGGGRFAGVVIDRARRLVLTSADAVAREKAVEMMFAVGDRTEAAWYLGQREMLRKKGHLSSGTVLAVDARRNLALLEAERLPDDVTEVSLARSSPAPGEAMHLLTHPARLEALWAYSAGVVRQRGNVALGKSEEPAPAVLLAQAMLNGTECGPAWNDGGEFVGFASGKVAPQQQVAYVIEAGEVAAFLDEQRPLARPKTVAEHLARAERFVTARQLDRARDEYTAALWIDPKSAASLAGRAWVLHLRGADAEAMADADRALAVDAKQSLARCARAAVLTAEGENKAAIAECDLAVKDDPKCALAFALRSLARPPAEALADADEAGWLDGKLALAYLARGRAKQSAEDFGRAVALDPTLAEAYRRRGDLHWGKSDADAAAADYAQALKLAPADAAALLGRARARLAKGRYEDGLADLDDVIRLRPAMGEAFVLRGGEKVRRNWLTKGAADLLEAGRLGLPEAALAELLRKAADLPAADEAEAYRLVLAGVKLDEGLRRRVTEALAVKDDRKRAEALRELVGVARARAGER